MLDPDPSPIDRLLESSENSPSVDSSFESSSILNEEEIRFTDESAFTFELFLNVKDELVTVSDPVLVKSI